MSLLAGANLSGTKLLPRRAEPAVALFSRDLVGDVVVGGGDDTLLGPEQQRAFADRYTQRFHADCQHRAHSVWCEYRLGNLRHLGHFRNLGDLGRLGYLGSMGYFRIRERDLGDLGDER